MPSKHAPGFRNSIQIKEGLVYDSDYYDEPVEDPVSSRLRRRSAHKPAELDEDGRTMMAQNHQKFSGKARHEYPYEKHRKSLEGPHGDPGESSTAVVPGISNEVPSKVKHKKQPKEQYKCTIGQCAERLYNFPSWLRHHCTEHEEHPDGPQTSYRCIAPGCSEEFSQLREFQTHMRTEFKRYRGRRNIPDYWCNSNPNDTHTVTALSGPDRTEPPTKLQLIYWGTRARSERRKQKVIDNRRKKHGLPPQSEFDCGHCKESFDTLELKQLHVRAKHPETLDFTCTDKSCKMTFGTFAHMRQHVKKNHSRPACDYDDGLYGDAPEVVEKRRKLRGYDDTKSLTPHDGTFLTRLVERLSRAGGIQQTQDGEEAELHSGTHYPGGYESEGITAKDKFVSEPVGLTAGQYIEEESTVEDEAMGGLEEEMTEKCVKRGLIVKDEFMEDPEYVLTEKYAKKAVDQDEAMGQPGEVEKGWYFQNDGAMGESEKKV